MIIGFLFLVYYLLEYKKIDAKTIVIAEGIIIAIIIARLMAIPEEQVIPEGVIKIIGNNIMKRKIGGLEYPNGTIIVPAPYCKLRYMGEWGTPFAPWKWEVGFYVTYPNKLKKDILLIFHAKEGYITGIVERPEGYWGQDSNDLKIMMPGQVVITDQKGQPGPGTLAQR